MRPFSFAFAYLAAAVFLFACGSGVPEGSTQGAPKGQTVSDSAQALTVGDRPFRAADCNRLLDPGLRAACQSCATNPNAFQGCTTRGNVFDPLSCNCVATPPGDSRLCGGIFCPAGGQCCTAGTAPFTVDFCQLPGSTLPAYLQQHSTCTAVCPSDRPSACPGNACVNLLTDNANCGTCGNACAGTGVTCGGGGAPGVCGCTPQPESVTCNGHCGGTVVTNNCGQQVTCNADCGICGYQNVPYSCNPRDCNCGFDLICSGGSRHRVPGFFQCCETCTDTCYTSVPIACPPH